MRMRPSRHEIEFLMNENIKSVENERTHPHGVAVIHSVQLEFDARVNSATLVLYVMPKFRIEGLPG